MAGWTGRSICPLEAEFGAPQWRFGLSTWTFTGEGEVLLCAWQEKGFWRLGTLDPDKKTLVPISLPYPDYSQNSAGNGFAVMLMGSATVPGRIMKLDLQSLEAVPLDTVTFPEIDPEYFSHPTNLEFPTYGEKTAFGYYYPPKNKLYMGLEKEKPPCLCSVMEALRCVQTQYLI